MSVGISRRMTLIEGVYEEAVYHGTAAIASTIFPALSLTAEQVLNPQE